MSTIKIRDIQVGMRVPAHNPQMTDAQRAAEQLKIDPASWRKFTLQVDKEDRSGKVKVTLLRPSTWLVDEIETTSLALLENLIAEAEAAEQAKSESFDHEVNGHVAVHSVKRMQSLYNEIQDTLSTDSLLETAGRSLGWVNTLRQLVGSGDPLAGLARFGFGQVCDQLSEDQRLEEAYWDAADEIQAGDGIGSVVWLDMPELGAVGFASVVGNEPYTQSDVDQLLVQLGHLEKPDPQTHRLLRLVANREDGSQTKIELIRSLNWIRTSLGEKAYTWAMGGRGNVEGQIFLDMPELRLNGYADVVAIAKPIREGLSDCANRIGSPSRI